MTIEKSQGGRISPQTLKWGFIMALTAIILLLPAGDVFTPDLQKFFAITVFCIMLIAFDLMPIMIPCILLPVIYVISGLAPSSMVFGAWSHSTPWMFLAVFIIANALTRVGLLDRIAYWSIAKVGGSFRRLAVLVLAIGLVLSLALPGGNAHVPLVFFVIGVCRAMEWKKTKESSLLLIYTLLGTYTTIKFFLNPYIFLIANMQQAVKLENISFFTYLYHNAVFLVWFVVIAVVIYKLLKPRGDMPSKEYFKEKYQSLGVMTLQQKRAVIITLVLLTMIMTTHIHHIDMGWCFLLVCCLMYFPGIRIGTQEDIKKANYGMVFFVAACMSIGSVGTAAGLCDMVTQVLTPHMGSFSATGFILLILVMGFFGLFFMPPLAILAVFTAPMTQMAIELGINPIPVWYTISIATNLIVFPYEYAAYKFTFSFDMIEMRDFVKVYFVKSVLLIVFTVVVAVPYWRMIGIL